MAAYKSPDFNERASAARAAKQSALEKLRNKPAIDPAIVAERQAARAIKDAAAAERRAARQAAIEEARLAKVAAAEAAELAARVAATPPPSRSEAELQAARDARYAARKARKR
ncbi:MULTISPECIES: DUF6481 family protein [unclassified Sphingomonas]|uniref:DUF6481 family protein n=1 Tax=unclassified Sphingomonas TaxID=196159 RepID=UPI0006FC16D4|nr:MULTISPECIES: DUF6481 family protein [unclassified Sphingomonas]KQX25071.1 hypothetical protein ASD17_23625 [Sphingomonas sp. Root1294]KQY66088.1 hypothetical protein ASD39_13425 [Sphingomonas sp. Root50]KRB89749.1 hypothetical protein ASE22_19170 [Sphingomonas sp. Root720]